MQLKNLSPGKKNKKKRKKIKKKKKSKQIIVFSQIFYRTAPSRGQQQQHHPAQEGTSDGDIALSHCTENTPISLLSSGQLCRNTGCWKDFPVFVWIAVKVSTGHGPDLWPPPGASSCVCAPIKFTLSLVVTSYLAREYFLLCSVTSDISNH